MTLVPGAATSRLASPLSTLARTAPLVTADTAMALVSPEPLPREVLRTRDNKGQNFLRKL